mgnify:CR=1 FL=1
MILFVGYTKKHLKKALYLNKDRSLLYYEVDDVLIDTFDIKDVKKVLKELDDVWDEDDRKRLESFKGTIEGNDMDMKVSYELFNLIEENYKYLDFYYNNDFVKLKITDFD